ncbi:MAG: hypothetical protein ACOX50_01505 [Patescibacteria group bacterium]|jgi:hypothetical protein
MLEPYPIVCYISVPVSNMSKERLSIIEEQRVNVFEEGSSRPGIPLDTVLRREQNPVIGFLRGIPAFNKYCQAAEEQGIPFALDKMLSDLKFDIRVNKDLTDWNSRERGTLFVFDDHSAPFEEWVTLAALSKAGVKRKIRMVAWRISPPNDLINALDQHNDLMIEVTPREHALEQSFFNRKAGTPIYPFYRILYSNQFPETKSECDQINDRAMREAAEELSKGSVVIMYPKGSKFVRDWQLGIGRIMTYLPKNAFKEVVIASGRITRNKKQFELDVKEAIVEDLIGYYRRDLMFSRDLRNFLTKFTEANSESLAEIRALDKEIIGTIVGSLRNFCSGTD